MKSPTEIVEANMARAGEKAELQDLVKQGQVLLAEALTQRDRYKQERDIARMQRTALIFAIQSFLNIWNPRFFLSKYTKVARDYLMAEMQKVIRGG